MARVECHCGRVSNIAKAAMGRAARCPACACVMRFVIPVCGAELKPIVFGARLNVLAGPRRAGEALFLDQGAPISVGKSPDQILCLATPMVSRRHCTFSMTNDGQWHVEDRQSRNGLFVNGQRVQAHNLREGDLLTIGEYTLKFARLRIVAEPLYLEDSPGAPTPGSDETHFAMPTPVESEPVEMELVETKPEAIDFAKAEPEEVEIKEKELEEGIYDLAPARPSASSESKSHRKRRFR